MTPNDVAWGFVEGLLCCLTPEALLLLPVFAVAAGAHSRRGLIALAAGLGLSLIITGFLAGSFGVVFGVPLGLGAIWLRRIVCAMLVVQGLALMSVTIVEHFPELTGGVGSISTPRGAALRLFLLGLIVGANWIPRIGPTVGKASLMAAETRYPALSLSTLFAFGVGASLPWIALGRLVRYWFRPTVESATEGMTGPQILGLTMLVVGILGGSGLEIPIAHRIDAVLPGWFGRTATRF